MTALVSLLFITCTLIVKLQNFVFYFFFGNNYNPLSTTPPNFSLSLSRPDLVSVSSDSMNLQWLIIQGITLLLPALENKINMVLCCMTFKTLFQVGLFTIEIGCLGHFMPVTITKICHLPKRTVCSMLQ